MRIANFFEKSAKLFLILSLCFLPVPAQAAVPKLISYQGLLKDGSGNLLTGTYSMIFKIYTISSGGTAAWSETQSTVSVSSGKFSVQLGSVTTLNLDFNSDYWLGITVGADPEMTPRVRLTSSPYGMRSDYDNNGFSQATHDALSHKNVEGVKDNTVNIGKTNFKLDAYTMAAANSMGDMIVDTFNDASGISAVSSSNYTWRGSPNYDVVLADGGIDSNTVLIPHMNGTDASTTFTDSSSSAKAITANGNAQIDTAQSKFGGASALFDGAGDYLSVPDSNDWDFGTGDFAIDMWVRVAAGTAAFNAALYDNDGADAVGGVLFRLLFDNTVSQFTVYMSSGTATLASAPNINFTTNTWHHVALTRASGTLRIFFDGNNVATGTNSTNITGSPRALRIGTRQDGAWSMNGWIDELRVSKGVSRWSATFTPPSAEYTGAGSSATVVSIAWTESPAPTEVIMIPDETLNTGSITYYVSRDNGTTWTQCAKETSTSISSQPSGTQLKWKAVINGDAELNAIAVAV